MPTAYTDAILRHEETTFRDFALLSATAFVDECKDGVPLPERVDPQLDLLTALEQARALAIELPTLSDEECERRAREEHTAALERWRVRRKDAEEAHERYAAMRRQVLRWHPPTILHKLRAFMIGQLDLSIAADCSSRDELAPKLQTGYAWREYVLADTMNDLRRLTRKVAYAREQCDEMNLWIRTVRDSLPPEDGPKP